MVDAHGIAKEDRSNGKRMGGHIVAEFESHLGRAARFPREEEVMLVVGIRRETRGSGPRGETP
jgi:hypothetical protein